MKRTILLLLLLHIITASFSQSIQELNKRNGFKHFKIGDSKAKFSKHLKYLSGPFDGQVTYKYVSDSTNDYSVFGYMFDGIVLGFDSNDKLSSVFILKEYKADDFGKALKDYSSILNSLMNLFGKPQKDETEMSGNITYFWTGQNISLYFSETYKGAFVGSTLSIMFLSNSISNKNQDF